MKVRDKTLKENDYKGHFVNTPDMECPCRSCFDVYNCYYKLSNKCIDDFQCLTNYNHGCPDPKPRPNHLIKITMRYKKNYLGEIMLSTKRVYRKCKRCGVTIDLAYTNFHNVRTDKIKLQPKLKSTM